MASLNLDNSTYERFTVTNKTAKEIKGFYEEMAKKAQETANRLKDSTLSAQLQAQQYQKLADELKKAASDIGNKLSSTIQNGMQAAADAVVADAKSFADMIGIGFESNAYMNVPKDVINSIITGKVYDSNWSLSSAIWGETKKIQSDIDRVLAEGVALNKSSYEIAKDLEKYVNPSAKKEWNWSKVYPGTNKKVDYNAQRLARTLISHAYQQSLERTCAKNPFVTGYIWLASNSDRVCEICAARDGQFYKKGELPLDHPNGMCTFEAEIGPLTDVADRLAAWANGAKDTEIDSYAADLFPSYTDAKAKAASNIKAGL